jgi:hypothetical protein
MGISKSSRFDSVTHPLFLTILGRKSGARRKREKGAS